MKRLVFALVFAGLAVHCAVAQKKIMSVEENRAFHEKITQGIKLRPGQWRPNFSSEQIAWISPPWQSVRQEYGQEFIYLDFPEAIKVGKDIIYLSHVHPRFPALYNYNLEKLEWKSEGNRLSYKRKLPNGLQFSGTVTVVDPSMVELRIGMTNRTGHDFDSILLQTCAFLNPIREFSSPTDSNKFVFIRERGWTSFADAKKLKDVSGQYYLGWLGGIRNIHLPFVAVKSVFSERYVVFTWLDHSYSFIGNASHPCFHSDPWFPDLKDGASAEITGYLLFHQGDMSSLHAELRRRFPDVF